MSAAPRTCAVIPTFDNPLTIGGVVKDVRRHLDDVLIVDDGSHNEARRALDEIAGAGAARVIRRDRN
ncbi:MAG TPA: glycosyltransferase, partial [Polyangia bacterium]|nr:glycosyltransferase [Polyangia bacterium]